MIPVRPSAISAGEAHRPISQCLRAPKWAALTANTAAPTVRRPSHALLWPHCHSDSDRWHCAPRCRSYPLTEDIFLALIHPAWSEDIFSRSLPATHELLALLCAVAPSSQSAGRLRRATHHRAVPSRPPRAATNGAVAITEFHASCSYAGDSSPLLRWSHATRPQFALELVHPVGSLLHPSPAISELLGVDTPRPGGAPPILSISQNRCGKLAEAGRGVGTVCSSEEKKPS
jgi:hypothetical protein